MERHPPSSSFSQTTGADLKKNNTIIIFWDFLELCFKNGIMF